MRHEPPPDVVLRRKVEDALGHYDRRMVVTADPTATTPNGVGVVAVLVSLGQPSDATYIATGMASALSRDFDAACFVAVVPLPELAAAESVLRLSGVGAVASCWPSAIRRR